MYANPWDGAAGLMSAGWSFLLGCAGLRVDAGRVGREGAAGPQNMSVEVAWILILGAGRAFKNAR